MAVIHTDYGALGCGQFGPGDHVSGHRPETTCPDCRENLIREGGMRPGMFYPTLTEKLAAARAAAELAATADIVHVVANGTSRVLCGATGDVATDPEWAMTRDGRLCPECRDLADERAFDRAHP